MEITISKQCLATALSKMSNIADRKSSMQILSNVLIDANGPKHVQIAATDLNLSASGVFPAEVATGGSITLPAKTFYDIVRTLPEGPVTLKVDGENVSINSGRTSFKLLGLPPEDFPRLPDISGLEFVDIECSLLSRMIECTGFSISTDETRPHINGALFQGDAKLLRMVTTDGHRLSKVEFKTEESGFYNFSIVIPNKGVTEIKRLAEDGEGVVSFASHEGSIFLRHNIEVEKTGDSADPVTAEFILVSKLIEAEFPPYEQVIPGGLDKEIIVPRHLLLDAMRRVSVVSSERTLGVKFGLHSGSVDIQTDNPSVGQGSEMIDVGYDGEELTIGFNARYFIDVLSVLVGEEVKIELSGPLDPVVIKDLADNYVGVIMPMRI